MKNGASMGSRSFSITEIADSYSIDMNEEDMDYINTYDFDTGNANLKSICSSGRYGGWFEIGYLLAAVVVIIFVPVGIYFFTSGEILMGILFTIIPLVFGVQFFIIMIANKRKSDFCKTNTNFIGVVWDERTEHTVSRDSDGYSTTVIHLYTTVRFCSRGIWYEVEFLTKQRPWHKGDLFQFCVDEDKGCIYESFNNNTINYTTFEQIINCL